MWTFPQICGPFVEMWSFLWTIREMRGEVQGGRINIRLGDTDTEETGGWVVKR
jgi:hypothetical protein